MQSSEGKSSKDVHNFLAFEFAMLGLFGNNTLVVQVQQFKDIPLGIKHGYYQRVLSIVMSLEFELQ